MSNIRILLVEDQPMVSMALQSNLRRLGHKDIHIAPTGEEALLLYQDREFDVILMDIHLPGKWDGITTAEYLVKHRPCPIIFITDDQSDPVWERAKATQPKYILYKPIQPIELHRNLQLAIDQTKLPEKVISQKADHVFIPKGQGAVKVHFEDITYLEAKGAYCSIYKINQEEISVSHTLNWVLENLASFPAATSIRRVHRSFAVNLHQVTGLENDWLVLPGAQSGVPIGPMYQEEVKAELPFLRKS